MVSVSMRRAIWWLVLLLAVLVQAGCNQFGQREFSVKYYYTDTTDNRRLALCRYLPEKPLVDKEPVILCHGLSYNLLFWDLADEVSLPRYLARAGYDVWSLSLRGAAPSSQPFGSAMRKLSHFKIDPQMFSLAQKSMKDLNMTDWSVDGHIKFDLPTAIKFVIQKTGHEKVHWIGHSMGAMVMFAYLEDRESANGVRSFVAVSAPMAIFHPLNEPFAFLLESAQTIEIGSAIVGTSAPAGLGAIFGDLGTPTDKLFYNGRNIDGGVMRLLQSQASEEMGPSQFKQLMNMVRTERFMSLDKSVDYTAGLRNVTTPTYLLVGTVDNMATPGAVQFAYRQIKSSNKQFKMFGRVNSQVEDYGHDDIIIGKKAREEVYPTILQWLSRFRTSPEQTDLMLQPMQSEN
ncbi:MAG: alpha/beta fold hydrolase [Sedimentisphaerales bacterium]|nr:alpha/beta fold hydrolase [Sedimentisphaerales bacterium]